jgi:predicted permease
MGTNRRTLSERLYRILLRLLPFDFRDEFASEMEEVFREQEAVVRQERGGMKRLRLWWETLVGIVRLAPREHLSALRQDAGYAWRLMRKDPLYTLAAVGILGLGIGVNTAVFSVVNSVLLRPLPYADGERIVTLRQKAAKAGFEDMKFSFQEINDYRQRNRTLEGIIEHHSMRFTLFRKSATQRVRTGVVSAGFFDFFGVRPLLGRTFVPSDDQPGAPAVLLLSYEFWKQSENGDPSVVGRTYEMNDRVHTVIGILPPLPQYPNENDVYMTTSACPFRSSVQAKTNRDARLMSVFARLKPGVQLERCRQDIAGIAQRLEQEHPESYPKAAGYTATSNALQEELERNARPMLLVMLGAAAFVLLIACANVANLTLARIARRQRELVVRTALGAGSGRLLRQLSTEGLMLALAGAVVGLGLASESRSLLVQFVERLTPRAREIRIDGEVQAFTMLCAVATSLFCGVAATLYSRENISSGLKESGVQSSAGGRAQLVRSGLIAAQVAFSYVLLVGAGLMSRTLVNLERVDAGFVAQHVLAMDLNLNWSKYTTDQQWRDVSNRLLEQAQRQPGVMSAAVSSGFPLDPDGMPGGFPQRFRVEGHLDDELVPVATVRAATPDYFRTLGIPVIAGRGFAETDTEVSLPVAVINRTLAWHYWRHEDPVGKRIKFDQDKNWITILGVVGDVREFGLTEGAKDQLYVPNSQNPSPGNLLLRVAGDPMSLARQMRQAVLSVDPQAAITRMATLEQVRSDSISAPRVAASLFGLFATLAMVIAVAGIGCALALSVRQRAREIGIRASLGADSWDLVRMVVRQGMWLVLLGLALGLPCALALTRGLQSLLFEVAPTDALTFGLVLVVLAGAALVASYAPARRAARIDPMVALRCE